MSITHRGADPEENLTPEPKEVGEIKRICIEVSRNHNTNPHNGLKDDELIICWLSDLATALFKTSGEEYKADFLWEKDGKLEKLLYDFANCRTEEYQKEIYNTIKSLSTLPNKVVLPKKHGIMPFSNRVGYYCISCEYELKDSEDSCQHNKTIDLCQQVIDKEI